MRKKKNSYSIVGNADRIILPRELLYTYTTHEMADCQTFRHRIVRFARILYHRHFGLYFTHALYGFFFSEVYEECLLDFTTTRVSFFFPPFSFSSSASNFSISNLSYPTVKTDTGGGFPV